MAATGIKEEARRIVDQLPENSTWDDLAYAIYVRRAVEAGWEDSKAGRVLTTAEMRRELGLPP